MLQAIIILAINHHNVLHKTFDKECKHLKIGNTEVTKEGKNVTKQFCCR